MIELMRQAIAQGIVASIAEATIWRWLSEDAIKPWNHRNWIFPRDPQFAHKAGRILDLYEGVWDAEPLRNEDCGIGAEHEYERKGAVAYVAAWDVRRACVFGRCEASTGIEPFNRLVDQVMQQEPYRSASRVFRILDNGSSHRRGQASINRLQERSDNIRVVHTPVHASWLNQIEIYFSVLQRKVLTPNDFASLIELEDRILRFEVYCQREAKPFQWKFTRQKLQSPLDRLDLHEQTQANAGGSMSIFGLNHLVLGPA